MIGKNNIEEKLFDYFEGDLSANEAKELENFVKDNPEYQVDFDAWKQSVIPTVSMQYQYADDLLVKEKSSPKGWLRWASGGALLCLVGVASVGLVTKYDGSQDVVAELQKSQFVEVVTENVNTTNSSAIVDAKLEITDNKILVKDEVAEDVFSVVNLNTANESKVKERSGGNVSEVLNKNITDQNSSIERVPVKAKSSTVKISSNVAKSDLDALKSEEELNELLDGFNIAALKEGAYEFMLPFAMRKDKTPYENPNQPKFFVTNNKDPYLNYSLAQILEENASFAGNGGEGIRVEYLYRTEWPSASSDNFSTQIISADGFFKKLNAGIGAIINADRLGHGALNATALSLIYSQKIIGKGISFEPSVKGTFNQRSIAWGRITTNDIKDPRNGVLYGSVPFIPENLGETEVSNFDLGLGMLVNAGKFYIGGQIDHVNQAEYTDPSFNQTIKMPTKISAMAGTDIYKSQGGKFSFSPSVNYINFGNYNALWMNTQFSFQGFFLAAGAATNEEFMTSLGYKNNLVRLTYGLGFSKPREFSGLATVNKYHESHQFSLRVNLHQKK